MSVEPLTGQLQCFGFSHHLQDDDAEILFDEDASGDKAVFTGGQSTGRAACSVGCQNNFYKFEGPYRDAAEADITESPEDNADFTVQNCVHARPCVCSCNPPSAYFMVRRARPALNRSC